MYLAFPIGTIFYSNQQALIPSDAGHWPWRTPPTTEHKEGTELGNILHYPNPIRGFRYGLSTGASQKKKSRR